MAASRRTEDGQFVGRCEEETEELDERMGGEQWRTRGVDRLEKCECFELHLRLKPSLIND